MHLLACYTRCVNSQTIDSAITYFAYMCQVNRSKIEHLLKGGATE